MSFLQAEITDKRSWWRIETKNGTWFVAREDAPELMPFDQDSTEQHSAESRQCAAKYVECSADGIESITLKVGYGVRSSASGYLDRTDWCVYARKRDAIKAYRQEQEENNESED